MSVSKLLNQPKVRCSYTRLEPVDRLKPNPANPNKHGAPQLALYAKILRHQGWRKPIVVSARSGLIVCGHGAVLTAKAEGWTKVPVDIQEFESEAEELAHLLADNKLPQLAELDLSEVAKMVKEIDGSVDLDLTGFSSNELDQCLAQLNSASGVDAEPQIDRAAELQKEWKTKLGQVWQLGEHRLMCGDSLNRKDVDAVIYFPHREPLSMIVTSPPYNQKINKFSPSGMHKEGGWVAKVEALAYEDDKPEIDYQNEQREMLSLWGSKLKREGSFFYNHKNRYRDKEVSTPLDWIRRDLELRQEIIWSRPGSVTQNARMFLPSDERIYWLYHGEDFYFNDSTDVKSFSTVWDINLETNKSHAVGFPVELPIRCIRACSKPGELIGEPYSGSGTTIIACEQLGRRCRAMEISPAYVAVALDRYNRAFNKMPVLISGPK